ncbi:MAG: hypothetical protein Q9166_005548 [cf. Caloplaca sp. 2 TL-2023]
MSRGRSLPSGQGARSVDWIEVKALLELWIAGANTSVKAKRLKALAGWIEEKRKQPERGQGGLGARGKRGRGRGRGGGGRGRGGRVEEIRQEDEDEADQDEANETNEQDEANEEDEDDEEEEEEEDEEESQDQDQDDKGSEDEDEDENMTSQTNGQGQLDLNDEDVEEDEDEQPTADQQPPPDRRPEVESHEIESSDESSDDEGRGNESSSARSLEMSSRHNSQEEDGLQPQDNLERGQQQQSHGQQRLQEPERPQQQPAQTSQQTITFDPATAQTATSNMAQSRHPPRPTVESVVDEDLAAPLTPQKQSAPVNTLPTPQMPSRQSRPNPPTSSQFNQPIIPQPNQPSHRHTFIKSRELDLLADAAQLQSLPSRILRIASDPITHESLERTIRQISDMNDIFKTKPNKQKALIELLTTLVVPETYWSIHHNMCKVVSIIGFPDIDGGCRRGSTISYIPSDGGSNSGSLSPLGGQPPACFRNFVQKWHQSTNFSRDTANPAVVQMMKMWNEKECYIYWQLLLTTWKGTKVNDEDDAVDHKAMDPDASSATDQEEPAIQGDGNLQEPMNHPPEDINALHQFLRQEYDRRKPELEFRYKNGFADRSAIFLKALLAPYLGFSTPKNLMAEGDSVAKARAKATGKMFDKQWNNTMNRGKIAEVWCREMGSGALCITKKKTLESLGYPVLTQILPIIAQNHPQTTEILDSLYKVFLSPLQSGGSLLFKEVGEFLRIDSIEKMVAVCGRHPTGLKGLLEGESSPAISPPLSSQTQSSQGQLTNLLTPPSTVKTPRQSNQNNEDDDAFTKDDIFDIAELLSEQQQIASLENSNKPKTPASTALHTPPPTTQPQRTQPPGSRRTKRAVSSDSESRNPSGNTAGSPSKRRR